MPASSFNVAKPSSTRAAAVNATARRPAALSDAGRSGDDRKHCNVEIRLRGLFIIIQSAFAVLLSAGTGLMIRSFDQLRPFNVGSRAREFGVRFALGATPSSLRNLVLGYSLSSVGIGIGSGLVASALLTRFMQSLLFETNPNDPRVYAVVTVMMIAAALAAGWWPARRASKVDVVKLLRSE